MKKEMKDKMERFALLPFSIGCVSESSVAVGANQPRSSTLKLDPNIKSPPTIKRKEEDEESSSSTENMKSSLKFLPLPKSSISKLFKSFKNFAQFFVYKEEIEEMEMEMEIGYPTDVKHVTHIGLDGSASANPIQAWDHLIGPDDQLPPIKNTDDPMRQFELSMEAQAGQVRLVKATSS